MKIYKLLFFLPIWALFSSCGTVHNRFLRADVVGFSSSVETSYQVHRGKLQSKKIQTKPYDLTTPDGVAAMRKIGRAHV